QFVVVDPAPGLGAVPGVQQMTATLKSSFELAGVEFGSAAFTANYDRADNVGVRVGGQSITFGLEGVDVHVGLKNNGIVVKDGAVATFQLGVVESFNLLGLKIDLGSSSHPLTIDFEPGTSSKSSIFAMSGDVKVSTAQQAVSSVSNKVFDTVAASFVADPNTGTPGLEIVGGQVDTLDLTISGDIDLFGLMVSPEGLNIDYTRATGDMKLTGGISVEELFKATATFGATGSAGGVHINTSTGAVTVDNLSLALTNVNLGVFKIDDLEVDYSVDPTTLVTQFDVTLMMSFPENWRVAGEIAFEDDKLQEISLEWDGSKQGRIPIGDTGLFLVGMEATVQNIDQPRDLTVSGEIVVEFGSEVKIFGQECTLFRAVGGFSANEDELTLGADVWLGAFTDGNGNTTGVLGTGSGEIDLDWNDQVYSADVHASLLDGTFTYDAKFNFDNGGDLWIAVDASVNVPHSVPLIGGTHLASMDFRFSYQEDHPENSYVAAWTDINLVVTSVDIGFDYTFDTKSVKIIGSHDVSKLRNEPTNDQPSVYSYTQEYDVPNGATSANLSVNFAPNSGTQTISVSTDGGKTFISEDDPKFAQLGFTKLTQLDTATSRNISIVDPSNKDNPPSVPLKPSGGSYILKLTSTNYQFPPTSATIDSITDDGHGNTLIHFSQSLGDLKVGDFFTVKGSDISGYNVEHAVNAILVNQTVVTDQPYSADSQATATVGGWDSPHFSATFYNPPPVIGLTTPSNPHGDTIQVPIHAKVDSAFTSSTTMDLYLDTDSSGYDGKRIARNVPYQVDSSGNITSLALATPGNLLPRMYYVYAVIDDGTNTPVFSAYSDGFTTDYAIQGSVNEQNEVGEPDVSGEGEDGWTVFIDVNDNGRLDSNEPVSAPTSNGGFYGISGWVTQNISSITKDASGKALLTFTSPLPAGLTVGRTITVLGNTTDYGGDQVVDQILGPTTLLIEKSFTTGINGSATVEVPQVPDDTPFNVVLINPLPDYFDFGVNGNTESRTYDGTNPKNADFVVNEKSAIQGTVFNDLNGSHQRAGQPGLAGWLVFLDQNQNGRLDPGEAYTTTRSDGSYNFAPFAGQQAGTYHVVVVPPAGAAALYTFENVNGTYVYDTSNSANVHGGTLVNGPQIGTAATFGIDARPFSGPSNNVLKLSGSNQFVEVAQHDDLEPGTGAFSAGAWVRFTTDTGFKQMIAGSQSPQSPFEGWSLLVSFNDFSRNGSGDRKLYLDLRQVGTGQSVGVRGNTSLADNQWYYVSFTYDPNDTASPIKLYVNGYLDGSGGAGALSSPDIATTDQVSFDLGNQGGDSPAFPMGGFLDDVSVWDTALSPFQILALADGGMTPSYFQTSFAQGHTVTLDASGYDVRQTDDSGTRNDFGALAFATVSGTV
ncbi:LamG-like jellyroll fold domain-containing protein, partial [Singulisphaera rosea]